MNNTIIKSFSKLKSYCEQQGFKGWDPYDGLNSKVFQALPWMRRSALCRLAVIQLFKRCPINLRRIALVPKEYNAKGIGLFLTGYCNLYNTVKVNSELSKFLGSTDEIKKRITELGELLISIKSKGYNGACWGYSFDWQSKAFFLPVNTPTVVATSFVVEALFSAYEITGNKEFYNNALSAANFIINDLNRIKKSENCFMFSYSPLDNRAVYNASLLGSKTLSLIYSYTHNEEYKTLAQITVKAVCKMQNNDGSFPHSDQVGNTWRDNFHTGFKLESIAFYQKYCNDNSFSENIDKGYDYWINNYFIPEKGIAKYYDNSKENDLIDLHCVAQSIPTLYKLNKLSIQENLVQKLICWAINNMQDKKGYFYFQKKSSSINKICYMRWPNAWMLYGISYWLKYCTENEKTTRVY